MSPIINKRFAFFLLIAASIAASVFGHRTDAALLIAAAMIIGTR